jgi:putative ABC transport system ATP-binding protein
VRGELLCTLRGVSVSVGVAPERFRLSIPTFEVAHGNLIAIVAPSGSGKSLFLETLALVRAPDQAATFLLARRDGGWLDARSAWARSDQRALLDHRRNEIGFLLQNGGLLRSLSVEANIVLPARIAGRPEQFPLAFLRALDLHGLRRRRPASLSGGQRQRIALVRAMSAQPSLLIADEPTAALDPRNADRTLDLIARLVEDEYAAAAVIVTHDGDRARSWGFEPLSLTVASNDLGSDAEVASREVAA